jgi:hypothetical protein
VTWRRLDCLNPNLQKMQVHIHRKDTRNRCRSCDREEEQRRNLQGQERCPVRTFKEMSGAPKSRCTVRVGRTWDRLPGASPKATEADIRIQSWPMSNRRRWQTWRSTASFRRHKAPTLGTVGACNGLCNERESAGELDGSKSRPKWCRSGRQMAVTRRSAGLLSRASQVRILPRAPMIYWLGAR